MNDAESEPDVKQSGREETPPQGEKVATDIASLEERVAALEKERDELRDLALRSRADLENYRKRIAREREEQARFAEQEILGEVLRVLDDFDRAVGAATADDSPALRQGLDLVRKSWTKLLEDHHVTEIPSDGEPFDPRFHEALGQSEAADVAPNTVVTTVRKGFRLYDRVIRPAQVLVSRARAASEPGESDS